MITVPTRFMREWIMAHYADNILRFWCQEDQTVHSVDIFVKAEPVAVQTVPASAAAANQPAGLEAAMLGATRRTKISRSIRIAISAPLDPRYTFDNLWWANRTSWHMQPRAAWRNRRP
jgi:chromosomal replication initiator protein